jgi:prepilin peptidase CpaA
MTTLSTIALLALLGPACWFDVRERRIPNVVAVAGAIAALLLRWSMGWGPLFDGLLGAGLALLVALTPFALGLLGGGDVKLLGAVGAFVGADRLFGGLLLIAVVGGVLALVEAVRRRALGRTLTSTISLGKQWMLFGRAGTSATLESPEHMTVPYGVAIAVGSLMWWFMGGTAL